jgi:hypothetical protein
MKALLNFLPRFDQDEFIFGKTMVFFRDFAYTALVKKYGLYLEDLHEKCRKIQGCLLKFRYMNRRDKKKRTIKLIRSYFRAKTDSDKYAHMMLRLKLIQRAIREKLHSFKLQKKIKNMMVMQSYIKKEVSRRNRLKYTHSLQIIINAIQRYKSWKLVQKYSIINQIKNYIIDKSYRKLTIKNKNVIETYLLGFLTQVGSKTLIMTANLNTKTKFREKYIGQIEQYLKGLSEIIYTRNYINKVTYTQSIIKTWIYR